MKVTLIFPRLDSVSGDPPLGVAYVASEVREKLGADVEIIDTTFHRSLDYVFSRLNRNKPDIAGIYVDTITHNDAVSIAEVASQ